MISKISKETFYEFLIKFVDTVPLWIGYAVILFGFIYASCIMKPSSEYPIFKSEEHKYWEANREIVFEVIKIEVRDDGNFILWLTQTSGDEYLDGCMMKAKYRYYEAKNVKEGDSIKLFTSYYDLYHNDNFYGNYHERLFKLNPGKPHSDRPVIDYVIVVIYAVITFFIFCGVISLEVYDEHSYSAIFVLMLLYLVTFLLIHKL